MVRVDVKKVGRIPHGGGWRVHGKGSAQAKAVARSTAAGTQAGYVYLHSAVDDYSRLTYTEALNDEKADTAIGFMHRAGAWFAAHGIDRIPPHPRRRVPLRPHLDLRGPTRRGPPNLEYPL